MVADDAGGTAELTLKRHNSAVRTKKMVGSYLFETQIDEICKTSEILSLLMIAKPMKSKLWMGAMLSLGSALR